jgi:ATP synthase subunit 6
MKSFFSHVLTLRGLVILGIIVGACLLSFRFAAHRTGENVFTTLYMHLVPSPLVEDNHAAHGEEVVLVEVPLPGFLSVIDYRGEHAEGAPRTTIFHLQIFQVASVLLCLVCFAGVPRYIKTGKGDSLARVFAGFAMWIRDEMVYPEMGKDLGRRFLPYFLSVFFFILFMNLLGLAPHSGTATASIFVTGAMAVTTLLVMVFGGMIAQGPIGFWKNLVPQVPLLLWPLMFIVELVGLLVKPFALMVRLFANMTGGHMVVLSFMGLLFFLGSPDMWGTVGGWGATPLSIGFAVFIMIIEAFVAMLQAYIFTQLSIIFVNASIHPAH